MLIGVQKSIADWAKNLGFEGSYNIQKGQDTPFGWWLADKCVACSQRFFHSLLVFAFFSVADTDRMVFSKVREALGLDRCHFQVCVCVCVFVVVFVRVWPIDGCGSILYCHYNLLIGRQHLRPRLAARHSTTS